MYLILFTAAEKGAAANHHSYIHSSILIAVIAVYIVYRILTIHDDCMELPYNAMMYVICVSQSLHIFSDLPVDKWKNYP